MLASYDMTQLSQQQKLRLYEDGYVHLPQVVPRDLLRGALRAINSSIGQHLDFVQMRVLAAQNLCAELKTDSRILDLFNKTTARSLTESALGEGKIVLSKNVQIALRFPTLENEPFALDPHVDGFHPSSDGKPGAIFPFTAIAGFFLNDLDEEWSANFTVWPGTHRLFAEYFRTHKPDPDLKFGIPPVKLPEPVQLKVKAGDMILAHFQLAHDATANMSDSIRYAVYFRMNHSEHPKESLEVLSDIWRYWGGMKEFNK